MLYTVKGDILLSQAQAIAHGIAPFDHFKTGLALSLRERWPALYKDFRHFCHQESPKPGAAWLWAGADGRVIVNLMTQAAPKDEHDHPGKATSASVNHALKALHQIVEKEDIRSLALPRLATGVGGMDWKDVEPLIRQHLGGLDIPVFIYETYVKGQKAEENLKAA